MATILEALENGLYNLDNLQKIGMSLMPLVKSQINNGVTLLNKGYDIYDEIEPLLEKYGNIENVPEKNSNIIIN